MNETRVQVVFKRGRPVSALFSFRPEQSGKASRQIHVRPNVSAHFDASGQSVGLEILLPSKLELGEVNEILRELGASPITEADFAPLRMV